MNCFKISCCLAFLSAVELSGQINPTVSSSTGNFSLTCANPSITLTANSSFTGVVSYTWTGPQLNVANAASVSAAIPGTYSVAASSGTILETTTVTIITNTAQPTLSLTSASASITCNTPTILMTATSSPTNVSYTWIEPGVSVGCAGSTCIAWVSGVYGVIVTDLVNGCQKTATIDISDNRLYPVFNSIGSYTVACPNGTVNLEPSLSTGTTNISFQWKIPAGAVTSPTNNLSLITNAPGEYTLTATDTKNGCVSNAFVSVFACVGIRESYQELKISGYPNPVSTIFKLEMDQEVDFIIDVTDVSGRHIVLGSNEREVNFAEFSPGLYIVTVQSTKWRKIFKVVKH